MILNVEYNKRGSGVYDRLEERVFIDPDCLRNVYN